MTIHIAYIDNAPLHQGAFEQLVSALEARGCAITLYIYDTQQDATNHLPYDRPDIVFVNLRMRDGRHTVGLDIVRALRQHPLCRKTAIIGVAESAGPIDQAAALAAGCHHFVPLPVHLQDAEMILQPLT